jgi:hypothetical protein
MLTSLFTFLFILVAAALATAVLVPLFLYLDTQVARRRSAGRPAPEPVSKNVRSVPRPRTIGTTALETALRLDSEWPPENWENALFAFVERYPTYAAGEPALYLLATPGSSFFRYEPAQIACECFDFDRIVAGSQLCTCGHSELNHGGGICMVVTTVRAGNQPELPS